MGTPLGVPFYASSDCVKLMSMAMASRYDEHTPALFDNTPSTHAAIEPMAPDAVLRRLGERLPSNLFLGTSSWNFPGWRGLVYSPMSGEKRLANEGLSAYAAHPIFSTVGIDRSFYHPMRVEQYTHFADQVPDTFRFIVKAPQQVTDAVLRDVKGRPTGLNPDFLNPELAKDIFVDPVIEGLKQKAGPLIFEMPPIPRALLREPADRHRLIESVALFMEALPKRIGDSVPVYGVEMRARALYTPRFVRTMAETGTRLVLGIHPSMPSIMRQTEALRMMDAPDVQEGVWDPKGDVIVRWSLSRFDGEYRRMKKEWAPFDALREPDIVTRSGIEWLMHQAVRTGQRMFVVANNKAEGSAPLTMRALAENYLEHKRAERIG